MSYWSGTEWVICVSAMEPRRRQRLTICHEYKHVIDHGRAAEMYGTGLRGQMFAEATAEYFAGCLLVPRQTLVGAWDSGMRDLDALAHRFEVSTEAIGVRLIQCGLVIGPVRPGRFGAQLSRDIGDGARLSGLGQIRKEAA